MIESDATPAGATATPKGRIITFYSYKGGTGRSMAAANVAWLLALNGYRVLVIDWDLEAPGIHRYFHPFLEDKELRSTEGLIDMVESLAAQAATSSSPLGAEQVDIIDYIEPLEWPRDSASELSWKQFGPRARIDLLPAGRQGPAYSRKLSAFNWIDFYERLGGRRLLDIARNQMRSIYDYVLIDSRTGVSDTSGICTVEMPDTLVICFTLNEQSIRGAVGVAESVQEHRSRKTNPESTATDRLRMFFVPTRVEITSERDKRETALDLAQRTFDPFLDHLPVDARNRYWGAVQLPYFPYYAFEEILAVFGDKPNELLSLTTPLKEITRVITDPPIAELPPLSPDPVMAEKARREVVGWYVRPSVRGQSDAVRVAQDIFDRCDPAQRLAMMDTLLRLVVVTPNAAASARSVTPDDLGVPLAAMAHMLAERQLLMWAEVQGTRTLAFRDPRIVERWEPLQRAIERDRRFLAWRTGLSVAASSWRQGDYDQSALMRGKVLEEAVSWFRERRADLNDIERKYIEDSIAHDVQLRKADEDVRTRAAELETRLAKQEAELTAAQPASRRRLVLIFGVLLAFLIAVGYMYYNSVRTAARLNAELMSARQAEVVALQRAQQAQSTLAAYPKTDGPTAAPSSPPALGSAVCPNVGSARMWAGANTFIANAALSRTCVERVARQLLGSASVVREILRGNGALTGSAAFVAYVLSVNGLRINPLTCGPDCLAKGLKVTARASPGDVVVFVDETFGLYAADAGVFEIVNLNGVVEVSHSALSRAQVRDFLRVPYPSPDQAPAAK